MVVDHNEGLCHGVRLHWRDGMMLRRWDNEAGQCFWAIIVVCEANASGFFENEDNYCTRRLRRLTFPVCLHADVRNSQSNVTRQLTHTDTSLQHVPSLLIPGILLFGSLGEMRNVWTGRIAMSVVMLGNGYVLSVELDIVDCG